MAARGRTPARPALLVVWLAAAHAWPVRAEAPPREQGPQEDAPPGEAITPAAPLPFTEGVFPCSQCHEGGGDPSRRTLAMHEDVQGRLRHPGAHPWCLDCHDLERRDLLRLRGGELVPYAQSYVLCGQCHYDRARDWRLGIHGKRIGRWDGPKAYFLCVHCHDPHAPRFEPLAPEPRPLRPEETLR